MYLQTVPDWSIWRRKRGEADRDGRMIIGDGDTNVPREFLATGLDFAAEQEARLVFAPADAC